MFKRFFLFAMTIIIVLSSLVSCKRSIDYSRIVSEKPDQNVRTGDYDLDFVSKPLFLCHLNNCPLNMQNAVRGLKNTLKSNVMTSTWV